VQIFQSDAGTDGWTAPRNTTTDKDGYFSVMDLGAGVYTVSASADGYSPDTPWRNGRRVDLSKGGETSVGDIPLLPAATVVGRVVDAETGQGIKGAAIELETTSQFMRFAQHSGRSGEDGSFILPGVAAGQYTLKTQAEGYAPVFRPNFITESGQRVDAGTIRLGRGFAVSGTVVDAEGKPVAGATVMLSERGAATGFGWEPPGTQLGTAQTASNGSFTIGGLIECEARAVVSASGFASARHDVKLAAGMAPLVLRIHRGVSITGRVLLPDGAPAAGALVGVVSHDDPAYNIHKMQPGQMRWFGERGVQATAVSDGTFLLSNVPPGTYLLMAFAGTGRGVSVDDLKVETGDLNVGDLRLPAPGTLRVTVTEAGQPVANLRVEARAGMGGWTSGSGGEVVPSAETDASGVALIADVPAGEAYVMTARDKEGAEAELFTRRRVNIKPGQTTEFRIELRSADAARIHVTLNGRPQFSEVMLLGTGDKASSFKQARLDEAGFFEMVNVVNGNYVLHFRVADKTMSSMVTVAVDKPGDLDVSRDFAGFGVAGKVTTPSNSPSERASVRVSLTRLNDPSPEQFAQWLRAETQCGADGLFRFDHVPAGNYRVTAALAGVGSVSQDVAVSSGDLSGLALELVNNSGRLRVTIKQIVGKPVAQQNFGLAQLRDAAGAIVDLESENAGFFVGLAGTVIDLPTIPAGTYTLVMSSAGCLTLEKAGVVISKGEQTAIEVDLTAAAELHLTVTNSEITQEQLDNAKVRYFDAQGAEITRHTNPFDAWSGAGAPEKPTLVARYIGPGVAKVRVKVQGFAEIELPVEFEPGKKIERNETLVAG
jgi:protocatechuate 3,4-dioxygenase beta subunit